MNYATVNWTTGDYITEAKMDTMVANDRAEDAHEAGIWMANSSKIQFRNASSTLDAAIWEDTSNILRIQQGSAGMRGLDVCLASQVRGNVFQGANICQFPPAPRACTLKEIFVRVAADGVAPSAGDMIFDINKNGTSVWASTQANRLKLLSGQSQGSQTSFDTTTVAKYDNFSADCDQTEANAQNLLFVIIAT